LHNHVIIGFCVEVVMSKCKLTRPLFYCIGYTIKPFGQLALVHNYLYMRCNSNVIMQKIITQMLLN